MTDKQIQDILLPCPIIGEVCDHPETCNCSICDRILLNARIAKQRRSMLSNEAASNSNTSKGDKTMSDEFKINDEVFVLDKEYARVFPVTITGKTGEAYNARYTVKLDMTPGVKDELTFHGIALPCPFSIPNDKEFTACDFYRTQTSAYEALVRILEREQEDCRKRLDDFPWRIRSAKERLANAVKAAGSHFKLGQMVWVDERHYGQDPQITEAEVVGFDRGDFQRKPYKVETKRGKNTLWCAVDQLFSTKEAAIQAFKERIKAEYEKKLAAIS